jgi:hypothetical protein
MACKNCKKNATILTNEIMGRKTTTKKCKDCKKGQQKDMEWLESPEGKRLSNLAKLTYRENMVVYLFCWLPLIIGYITIVRFFISLFTS